MHKLIRTIAIIVTLTTLFGAVIFTHAQMAMPNIPGQDMPIKVQETAKNNPGAQTVSPSFNPIPTVADIVSGIGGSFLGWISLKAIGYVSFTLSYIAGLIGSTAFTLAGILVELGLYFNTTILNSPIVQLGWRFCRDLANLGFTIGIVVIAYATMLGIESYGMKKILINFAFAAIIVNFSFSIAGFAIDISNMLTHFFVNASIGGGGVSGSGANIHKFAETLASAFSPQKLLITDSLNLKAYESLADDGMIAAVISIFFVALFTALAALGMLMVGLTTISRFIRLSGLVIVMPIAILCAAFPNTRKWWGKWYDDFFSQLTYLPIATFSMYLVIMFVQIKADVGFETKGIDMKNLINSFEQAKTAGSGITATKTLELMAAPLQTITDMVLVLAMLFIGITKSAKLSGAGGDIALKWTTGLKDWAVGAPKGAAGWAGRKYLSGGGDGTKEGNRGTRLASFLQRIPLISRFAPQVNKFAAGTSKNLGNLETEYKGMGDVQLRNALYNPDIKLNPERMAAAAKEAVARGLLNNTDQEKNISQEKLNEFIPALKRYGFDTEILKKAPHLYGKFGLNIEKNNEGEYINKEDGKKLDDAIKAFKPEDGEDLPVEALEDIEVVRRLSGDQLAKLPKNKEHRAAFSDTIIRLREKIGSTEFDKYMKKAFAKKEAAAALTPQLLGNKDVVRNLTNDHLKYLSDTGKEKQRDAFLATINEKDTTTGEYKLSEKEFTEFMGSNFAKAKDINEINPDIIRNDRIFGKLQGMHISQLQKEPETAQHIAVLEKLRDEYRNAFADPKTLTRLDSLAKVIVDNKDNSTWSAIDTAEGKAPFNEIEMDYRRRHPDEEKQQKKEKIKVEIKEEKQKEKGWWEDDNKGGNPPSAGPQKPPQNPPAPPSSPTGGSASVAPTYTLAPQKPTQPVTPPPQPAPATTPQPKPTPNKPQRTEPKETEPTNSKGPDIGRMIDAVLESESRTNNPEYVLQEEFPEPPPLLVPMTPKTTPIAPPDLNKLARIEENPIQEGSKTASVTATPPPTPILPEPIRTTLQKEKDEKDNQERGNNTI